MESTKEFEMIKDDLEIVLGKLHKILGISRAYIGNDISEESIQGCLENMFEICENFAELCYDAGCTPSNEMPYDIQQKLIEKSKKIKGYCRMVKKDELDSQVRELREQAETLHAQVNKELKIL
jgi:hypothetical protein